MRNGHGMRRGMARGVRDEPGGCPCVVGQGPVGPCANRERGGGGSWPPPQMPIGLRWVAWGHRHGLHIRLDICTGSAPHETILFPTCPVPVLSYAAMSPCHRSAYSAGCTWRLGKGDPCAVCTLQLSVMN